MADVVALVAASVAFVFGAFVVICGWPPKPDPEPSEVEGFPGPEPERSARIENVVTMMTQQDLVTWAAMSISVTAQVLLVGFAVDKSPESLGWIAVLGIVVAGFFVALIARSNAYMSHYMRLLRTTRRQEFQPAAGIPSPSARLLAHFLHIGFVVAWFVVAVVAFRQG